jgi:tRNA(Ile)-lysidine synthase
VISILGVLPELLELNDDRARRFVISLSGGVDSVCLLHLLTELREVYPLELYAFHMNFGLRGKESKRDEQFCRKICQETRVPLVLSHYSGSKKSFSQAKGRAARLEAAKKILPDAEWVEAHHFDDNLETFLFRLIRGSGSVGLSGLQVKSVRAGRKLWRPLLPFRKKDLLQETKRWGWKFVEDRSNREIDYDRNWIRLELIPRIEKRFPHFSRSIERLQDQFREQEKTLIASIPFEKLGKAPSLSEVLKLSRAQRHRVLSTLFLREAQIHLDAKSWGRFHRWLEDPQQIFFNLPKAWRLAKARDALQSVVLRLQAPEASPLGSISSDLPPLVR